MSAEKPTTNAAEALTRVSEMADALTLRLNAVRAAEETLQAAKADLREIEEEDFPALMQELGLSQIKLSDGRVIELKPDIRCGISEDRRPAAHAWLRDNGFGGLIKTALVVPFGKDQDELMREAEASIIEQFGIAPDHQERVHPQTLKSFLKEQRAAGAALPAELFGLDPYNVVKVKASRN